MTSKASENKNEKEKRKPTKLMKKNKKDNPSVFCQSYIVIGFVSKKGKEGEIALT